MAKTQVLSQSLLASGDNVRVQLDIDVFKAMQDGHGGWNDSMSQVRDLWCALIKVIGNCNQGMELRMPVDPILYVIHVGQGEY